MSSKLTVFLFATAVALLGGCATTSAPTRAPANSEILTPDTIMKSPAAAPEEPNANTGIDISPQAVTSEKVPKPEIEVGTGKFFNVQPGIRNAGGAGEGEVTFNFENQPIQAVVKAILGDMLQDNYSIAPNVGGNVTFSTAKPIKRSEALPVLEMLLSWTGNTLVRENGRYTVLPVKDAIPGKLAPTTAPARVGDGYQLRIFPLQYISPSEMAKLLKPYAKPEAFVSIDTARSLLVMAGTPNELLNYERTIDTFDVDWLKGMSIGVYTLQHVDVEKLMPDLLKIFGSDGESPLAGMFRFMPIDQTNSIVVITPQPEYLRQAQEWLYRLDRGGAENVTQLYVYNVKNLKAADLADYLSQIFLGTAPTSHTSTSGNVGQGLRPVTIGGIGGMGGSMNYSNNNRRQQQTPQQERQQPGQRNTTGKTEGAGAAAGKEGSDIRISSIDENNQLMVMATPVEWDSIEAAIKKLDVIPLQVQIEARILEVTLSGDLNLGLQWYLNGLMGTAKGSAQANGAYPYPEVAGNRWDRHRFSLGATGDVTPSATGGLFYSFLSKNFEVAIDALEKNGTAKTLSAPSLVVANNQEAQINVGTQIPVVQTFYNGLGVINNNTNNNGLSTGIGTTGSVQYLNTGVVLSVTPRVNPGGLVYLDVSQEVSNPGAPAGGNANPPINQRQIQTEVAVQSGETILLGGLISENTTDQKTGIPGLSRIPILGNLFGSTTHHRDRTELIVLITPRVIRDSNEARQITDDYSRQFQSLVPLRSRAEPPVTHEAAPPAHDVSPKTQEEPHL